VCPLKAVLFKPSSKIQNLTDIHFHLRNHHHLSNLVGVLGFDPSREQSSTAKGFIRASCVPTPTPLFTVDCFSPHV
jgi:hypothetical protein